MTILRIGIDPFTDAESLGRLPSGVQTSVRCAQTYMLQRDRLETATTQAQVFVSDEDPRLYLLLATDYQTPTARIVFLYVKNENVELGQKLAQAAVDYLKGEYLEGDHQPVPVQRILADPYWKVDVPDLYRALQFTEDGYLPIQ